MKNQIKTTLFATLSILTVSCSSSSSDSPSVKDIDGNNYSTVTIGTQTWLKTNLNVSHYKNGDLIPQVTDPTEWENQTAGAWCYYENSTPYGTTYAKLYNWYAVHDSRGLAPQGWHVPSKVEYTTLTDFVGTAAGGYLKATTLWNAPNTAATDTYGFTALPGGYRYGPGGTFSDILVNGSWWTSSESNSINGFCLRLNNDSANHSLTDVLKNYGYSVRCIKD